jgi:hypothetical protein
VQGSFYFNSLEKDIINVVHINSMSINLHNKI